MFQSTISLAEPEQALQLFGARDQHLRAIRDTLGVCITHRDGEIRVTGSEESVGLATTVLEQLKQQVEQRRGVSVDDVSQLLAGVCKDGRVVAATRIDVFSVTREVRARTAGQRLYVQAIRDHDLIFAVGPAGTGKTYLAVAMAVEALKQRQMQKIVLVRPAVEAGESLGYLPGDLQAKINPYLRPLLDALYEMVDYDQIKQLMERDTIEVLPLAYMRGRTLSNAFIILDEAQNTTIAQMKMFLTRMGENSKIVVSGDTTQIDLPLGVQSGLVDALRRLKGIRGVSEVRMTSADIVRHRLVGEILEAYDNNPPPPQRGSSRRG